MPTQIISFDNDDDDADDDEGRYGNAAAISASAPPTCLNSPTVVTWPKDRELPETTPQSSSNDEPKRDTANIVLDVKPVDWGRW